MLIFSIYFCHQKFLIRRKFNLKSSSILSISIFSLIENIFGIIIIYKCIIRFRENFTSFLFDIDSKYWFDCFSILPNYVYIYFYVCRTRFSTHEAKLGDFRGMISLFFWIFLASRRELISGKIATAAHVFVPP